MNTPDLNACADWLEGCGIETVAMESTGVYWIPLYEILEARGFEVYLVNARHAKNLPGRKNDEADAQWLRRLHTFGLLNNSFRPDSEMRALRAYMRHRSGLIAQGGGSTVCRRCDQPAREPRHRACPHHAARLPAAR